MLKIRYRSGNNTIVEHAPCKRTLLTDNYSQGYQVCRFVSLPWVYYNFYRMDDSLYGLGVVLKNSRFTGLPFLHSSAHLPHTLPMHCCLGDAYPSFFAFLGTNKQIKDIISIFWQTAFFTGDFVIHDKEYKRYTFSENFDPTKHIDNVELILKDGIIGDEEIT